LCRRTSKNQLYQEAFERVRRELDVRVVLQRLRVTQFATMALLNDSQFKFIQRLARLDVVDP